MAFSSTLQRLILHLHGIGKSGISTCGFISAERRELLKSLPPYETRHPKRAPTIETNESRPKIVSQRDSTTQGRARSSGLRQTTIFEGVDMNKTQIAYRYIGRFFYGSSLPINPIDSTYFKEMCQAIANCGPGFVPPSSFPIRTTILQQEKKLIQEALEVRWLAEVTHQYPPLICALGSLMTSWHSQPGTRWPAMVGRIQGEIPF